MYASPDLIVYLVQDMSRVLKKGVNLTVGEGLFYDVDVRGDKFLIPTTRTSHLYE